MTQPLSQLTQVSGEGSVQEGACLRHAAGEEQVEDHPIAGGELQGDGMGGFRERERVCVCSVCVWLGTGRRLN